MRFRTTRPDTPLRELAREVAPELDLSDHVEERTLLNAMRALAMRIGSPPHTARELVAWWPRSRSEHVRDRCRTARADAIPAG